MKQDVVSDLVINNVCICIDLYLFLYEMITHSFSDMNFEAVKLRASSIFFYEVLYFAQR